MRRLPPCELAGSLRLKDDNGTELFAGIRLWVTPTEVGIMMNDGRGGPAETLILTHRPARSALERFIALTRRNAHLRRFSYARLYPQTQEVAQ